MEQITEQGSMLRKLGYSKTQYPEDVRVAVQKVVKAWNEFCAQPREHKELIVFGKTGGYENKDRRITPESRDHKEDFHITLGYEFQEGFQATKADTELIKAGKGLLSIMRGSLVKTAEILTKETGVDYVELATKHDEAWVLRLLHYYPGNMDSIPAHDHCDKGGHTHHLYDSTPGFEYYWEGEWRPLRFTEEEMVFFPGLLGQYYSYNNGESEHLPASCHRVVSTTEIVDDGRVSLVLFNDYKKSTVTYDKAKWGPTQNVFPPGANYKMSFDEFSQYFKLKTEQDAQ